MSKKNFKGGFDGLLGNESSETNEIISTQNKQLKKVSKNKDEIRATFIINIHQLEQMKAISYWDRKLLKTVLCEALDNYFKKYQIEKGEIKIPLK